MVLDSLKGVAVLKSVRLMWQSTISIDKNFLDPIFDPILGPRSQCALCSQIGICQNSHRSVIDSKSCQEWPETYIPCLSRFELLTIRKKKCIV